MAEGERELALYDGRDRLGAMIARAGGVDAFDVNGVHLGHFPNVRKASAAIVHSVGMVCDVNARRDNSA